MDLINFWFNHEDLWFNAKPQDDELIKQQFKHLITDELDIDSVIEMCDLNNLLTYILIYDQIIRHVYRGDNEKIKLLSKYALKLSLFIIESKMDQYFTPAERCFVLMPLRHTFNLEYLNRALDKIKEYRQESDSKYYIRFYKATILSMSTIKAKLVIPEPINDLITDNQILPTLDPECVKNLNYILNIEKTESIYKAFKTTLSKLVNLREITLSLSGGVDSMISSFILYHLSHNQTRFKIIAITIDYGNREDHQYEVEFVKRWCKLLNITHYVRRITELKRVRTYDRDIYEKLTRKIRFDMYRIFNNPVILGHNQGDCLENIINNIKKSRSNNNLRGMSELTQENDVLLVRPMLDVSKIAIKAFAKKYHIPHLPNSTPPWSERGEVRDELLPFINKFDPAIIPGLLDMADNMKQMYQIYEQNIIDGFIKKIQKTGDQIIIPLDENAKEKHYGFIFWKDVIKHMNLIIPSNKSIEALVIRIEKNQYGVIKLTKEFAVLYSKEKLIFNHNK